MAGMRSAMVGLAMAATMGAGTLRADSRSVPFDGRGTGEIVEQTVLAPDHVRLVTVSHGQATQLGRFFRVEVLDLNPATGSFTGWLAFVSANGSLLVCDVTGQFISAAEAVGDYAIRGGTGRFRHAEGQAKFNAVMTGQTTFQFSFDGEIDR